MGESMKNKMRKGLWSPDEDEKLSRCIAMYMNGSWSDIARKAGLQRCGKSCRRRWMNHLRPDLKRGRFTPAEISRVVELHNALGNRWSEIASHLVGRTDNDVKNLWNTQIKRQFKPQTSHPDTLTVNASAVDVAHVGEQLSDAGAGDTSVANASQTVLSDMHTLIEVPATIAMISSADCLHKVNMPVVDSKLTAYQPENPARVGKPSNIKSSVFTFPFRCDDSEHEAKNPEDVLAEGMRSCGALPTSMPSSPILQDMHANIPQAFSSSNLSKLTTTSTLVRPADHHLKYVVHNADQGGQRGALNFSPILLPAHEQHSYKALWHLPDPTADESTLLRRSMRHLHNSVLGADSEGTTSASTSITSASSDVEDYANSCSWWSSFEETDFQLSASAECWQPLEIFEL